MFGNFKYTDHVSFIENRTYKQFYLYLIYKIDQRNANNIKSKIKKQNAL